MYVIFFFPTNEAFSVNKCITIIINLKGILKPLNWKKKKGNLDRRSL